MGEYKLWYEISKIHSFDRNPGFEAGKVSTKKQIKKIQFY